ncbi:hypothetical protein F2Q69_00033822 [Brassica cretica]|uniref:Uncharacterized protein n=1 Tax=Brassica cretica TaxID=69181 RepID=A0A8S9SLE1_BRACR|nr:hypothetical protein F2Q69_00033822 [Brassica cretica]
MIARSLRNDRALARARSLRSDQAGRSLGRYIATGLWLGLGCYAATGQRVCVLHIPFYYLFRKYDLREFSGVLCLVTMVTVELIPEVGVPEGIGCPYLRGPFNQLTHLP